jgi:hypothetical protein
MLLAVPISRVPTPSMLIIIAIENMKKYNLSDSSLTQHLGTFTFHTCCFNIKSNCWITEIDWFMYHVCKRKRRIIIRLLTSESLRPHLHTHVYACSVMHC